MKRIWAKEAFIIPRWSSEGARIVGLADGWLNFFWPFLFVVCLVFQGFWLIGLLLEYAPWAFWVLSGLLMLPAGYHFDISVSASGVRVRKRFWGIKVAEFFFAPEEACFDFRPGDVEPFTNETIPERAVIRACSDPERIIVLGDDFSALRIHQVIEDAWRMIQSAGTAKQGFDLYEKVRAPREVEASDVGEIARRVLARGRSEPLIFVEGWTVGAHRRIGIFFRYMSRIHLVFDGYVDVGQVEGLRERLDQDARVLQADWDEMAHTERRRYVWSHAPLVLYRRGRDYLSVASQHISLGGRIIHKHEISRVVSSFSGWTTGVDIELKSGERVNVARHVCWGAIFDPLYDAWELEFDTIWSESLARSLAEAIDVGWTRDGY